MKPWITTNRDNCIKLSALAQRLGFNNRDAIVTSRYYSLVSYSLREAIADLNNYYLGRHSYYKHIDSSEINIEHPETYGRFENSLILILTTFHPSLKHALEELSFFNDRSGVDSHNPCIHRPIGMGYLPKGITIFNPDLQYQETLSAQIQRECIKESAKDPYTPEQDKTLTVKIFGKPGDYFYCFVNKRSPATLRRIIYKAFIAYCFFNKIDELIEENQRPLFLFLMDQLAHPTEHSANQIVDKLTTYIEQKCSEIEANLIENFAKEKQNNLNASRKNQLSRAYESAKHTLESYESSYKDALLACKNAEKNLSEYSEIDFSAISVFLSKIKDHPGLTSLVKIGHTLQFQLEEPLLHTSSEIWTKYITNPNSDLNYYIKDFVMRYHSAHRSINADTLRFCTQRFFKELFVDQNIRLFTSCVLGIDEDTTSFDINKYELAVPGYFPHPHIGTTGLTCWSEARREIVKNIMNNDGETAFLQLKYALQQMSATDNVVSRKLIQLILSPTYDSSKIYLRKGKENRESFVEIMQEFIQDETNKINAIIDSER